MELVVATSKAIQRRNFGMLFWTTELTTATLETWWMEPNCMNRPISAKALAIRSALNILRAIVMSTNNRNEQELLTTSSWFMVPDCRIIPHYWTRLLFCTFFTYISQIHWCWYVQSTTMSYFVLKWLPCRTPILRYDMAVISSDCTQCNSNCTEKGRKS